MPIRNVLGVLLVIGITGKIDPVCLTSECRTAYVLQRRSVSRRAGEIAARMRSPRLIDLGAESADRRRKTLRTNTLRISPEIESRFPG
jgi:hypothetical protein